MAAPTVRASCGVPVTVTSSPLNSTVTSISSFSLNTPPAPEGRPPIARPVTIGRTAGAALPSTSASPSPTAWAPRSSAAALAPFAASAIVPPFSVSAPAPMLIPSASRSARATR